MRIMRRRVVVAYTVYNLIYMYVVYGIYDSADNVCEEMYEKSLIDIINAVTFIRI